MGKKEAKGRRTEEVHSCRELCVDLFEIKVGFSEYMHSPLTQKDIDLFPQMVRLANEKKIEELGLKPKVSDKFRLQVEQSNSLKVNIGEATYYSAIDGVLPAGIFGKKVK